MNKIFVFDTNTLISAHLLPDSIAHRAYLYALDNGMIVHSSETLTEFIQVFTRPKFDKYVGLQKRMDAISIFEAKSFLIEITHKIEECRDKNDDKFLELALSAEADYIITGDKDLLVLNPFRDINILSSGDFLKVFS